MSVRSKIRAIIGSIFQLGNGGPNIKASSGVVEARNAADDAYAIIRGADAVGSNDLINKSQLDASIGGAQRVMRFTFGLTDTDSTNTIPANARILEARIEITTPYDNSATIDLGVDGGTADLLVDQTDIDSATADIYSVPQDTDWGGSAAKAQVTVGNAPTAGAGVATIVYTEPLA